MMEKLKYGISSREDWDGLYLDTRDKLKLSSLMKKEIISQLGPKINLL